jgi:superfamily II DNA or RNA helicase
MVKLNDLRHGVSVMGIVPGARVVIIDVTRHGDAAVEVTYQDASGSVDNTLLFRDDEDRLSLAATPAALQFAADPDLFRMVSEAFRIGLAYLFDPYLAVHTSLIEPLPHQIEAVYGDMLPRQPLKFLLADDPGAGKTIMAGLLIKELMARGDVERCLICAPGSLVEQWQDEMQQKFSLPFEIITRERIESSLTGNPFSEISLAIGRLDQLARSDDIRARIDDSDWDLIVCDEAHKMSAHHFGQDIQRTKRYELGELLRDHTRHFLLMTATPHNGKNEDFELFLTLLDPDRFESGSKKPDAGVPDASDLWRRTVKEGLVRFDGTPLFPERKAYTVPYTLSDPERLLYQQVTDYVSNEMNRADRLREEGQGRRGNNVGFALTVLQRRLASSPEAIYMSLQRRRERLEKELANLRQRGVLDPALDVDDHDLPSLDDEDDYDDFYERPEDEVTRQEEEVLDRATAARTLEELEAEISSLHALEQQARHVRGLGTDTKWRELSSVLQQDLVAMRTEDGTRRKIIIFTEHRDTLRYLARQIGVLLGDHDAVIQIHGGLNREARRAAQHAFINDKTKSVLLATDAAGEGVNLQRAHLMVNYDLPWNPNRIEQRFGRVHRIGQTEVCHLWNLVAMGTREGDVYHRLLVKLEQMSAAMGGKVFDVIGQAFEGTSLRDLLIRAIRYGEDPEIRKNLFERVETPLGRENIMRLYEQQAIAADNLGPLDIARIREDMERAEARKLQPHFIRSFFIAAFKQLGGRIGEREPKRYEITRVPASVRNWKPRGRRTVPVLERYERVCFEKEFVNVPGKPTAEFLCPGHPLLDAVIEIIQQRDAGLLRQGAILIDESEDAAEPRALVYLQHEINDSRPGDSGGRHVVSRRMVFVEIDREGDTTPAGWAPYLDYRPPTEDERAIIRERVQDGWFAEDLERTARSYAIGKLVPEHLREIRARVEVQVDKTLAEVRKRLTREVAYWDRRAEELKAQELAGKRPRLNSGMARRRAEELHTRLQRREAELAQARALSARPPVVMGIALVVPQGMLADETPDARTVQATAAQRKRIERLAVAKVMEVERNLGREPQDVGVPGNPWDVESLDPAAKQRLFIEVKGRDSEADTVCVTRNEVLTALNKPDEFILAIVQVAGDEVGEPHYIRQPFEIEPDFGVTSVNYRIADLLTKAEEPY